MLTRTMDYWLNVDSSSRIAKLHKETCIYCKPYDQHTKGINKMKRGGGWLKFESLKEVEQYCGDLGLRIFLRPCKVCQPE